MSAFHGNLSGQRQTNPATMASNEIHTNPSSNNDAGMTANSSRQNAPQTQSQDTKHTTGSSCRASNPIKPLSTTRPDQRFMAEERTAALSVGSKQRPRGRGACRTRDGKVVLLLSGTSAEEPFLGITRGAGGGGFIWVERLREESRHGHLRGGHGWEWELCLE